MHTQLDYAMEVLGVLRGRCDVMLWRGLEDAASGDGGRSELLAYLNLLKWGWNECPSLQVHLGF